MSDEDPLSTVVNNIDLDARERLVAHYIIEAIERDDEEKDVPTTAEPHTITTSEVKRPCEAIDWSRQLIRDLNSLYEAGIVCPAKQTASWQRDDAMNRPKAIRLQSDTTREFVRKYVAITPDEYWDEYGATDPESAEEAIEAVQRLQSRVEELEREVNEVKAIRNGALGLADDAREAMEHAAAAETVDDLEERLDEFEQRLNKLYATAYDRDADNGGDLR